MGDHLPDYVHHWHLKYRSALVASVTLVFQLKMIYRRQQDLINIKFVYALLTLAKHVLDKTLFVQWLLPCRKSQ